MLERQTLITGRNVLYDRARIFFELMDKFDIYLQDNRNGKVLSMGLYNKPFYS
jgi:hypothetical protein